MIDININPQLHRPQDPPLTSEGERGRRGENCEDASEDRRRISYPKKNDGGEKRILSRELTLRKKLKNCHALLNRTNSSDNCYLIHSQIHS